MWCFKTLIPSFYGKEDKNLDFTQYNYKRLFSYRKFSVSPVRHFFELCIKLQQCPDYWQDKWVWDEERCQPPLTQGAAQKPVLPQARSLHRSWFALREAVCFGSRFWGAWLAGGTGLQPVRTGEGMMHMHAACTAQSDAGTASSSQGAGQAGEGSQGHPHDLP